MQMGAIAVGGAEQNLNVTTFGGDALNMGSNENLFTASDLWLSDGSGTNFDRFREAKGRVNATDGLGAALVGNTWATQGPVTTHATGILTALTPQVLYDKATVFLAGIGGSGAVTCSINASPDGAAWVSVGVVTAAGNTNGAASVANFNAQSWAVSVVSIGATTTITSNIALGQ